MFTRSTVPFTDTLNVVLVPIRPLYFTIGIKIAYFQRRPIEALWT